jgi:hypothetical protein
MDQFNYTRFWKIFYHLRYAGMKNASLDVLIQREDCFAKLGAVLAAVQHIVTYELRTQMVMYERSLENELSFLDVELNLNHLINAFIQRAYALSREAREALFGKWLRTICYHMQNFAE